MYQRRMPEQREQREQRKPACIARIGYLGFSWYLTLRARLIRPMAGSGPPISIFSLKSWLFTPGTMVDRFDRAAQSHASAMIIDLEDSVAPASKPAARLQTVDYLESRPEGHIACALRINAPNTLSGLDDLRALLASRAAPELLVVPKCDSPGTIGMIADLLKAAGKPTQIIALVETARGLAALDEMASRGPRPAAFLFGAADLAADLGTSVAWEPMLLARLRVVQAAALAGIAALDSPWFDLSNQEGMQREARASAGLGFHGKCAIHPKQIQAINEAFTPTEEEIEKATRVIETSQKGAGLLGSEMVDEATARKARLILARAGRIDL